MIAAAALVGVPILIVVAGLLVGWARSLAVQRPVKTRQLDTVSQPQPGTWDPIPLWASWSGEGNADLGLEAARAEAAARHSMAAVLLVANRQAALDARIRRLELAVPRPSAESSGWDADA